MKGRVNTQLFYSPVHGWSVATTTAKFINAEWVWLPSQPTFFDGGMIFQIIQMIKVYPKSWRKIHQPTLHANDLFHYFPPYFFNHWKYY